MIELAPRGAKGAAPLALLYLGVTVLGATLSAGLLVATGHDAAAATSALIEGAVGSRRAILGTLEAATPLALVGLATVVAYRARLWNVGQEGQVLAGAMGAWQATLWLAALPAALALPAAVVAGVAAGAALGLLAAWLRERFRVSEIVSTVMLNYAVLYLLSWLLAGPWQERGGTVAYPQTPTLAEPLRLPALVDGTKLSPALLAALAAAPMLRIMLRDTALGFEIRALGANPEPLRQRGTDTGRVAAVVLMISGGLAALAGIGEVFGVLHRVSLDALAGIGFAGIVIGLVGGLTPMGTLAAALLFGALRNGALFMSVMTGVPISLVSAIEGISLVLCLVAGAAARLRVVRT